jgi:hypothetical protein
MVTKDFKALSQSQMTPLKPRITPNDLLIPKQYRIHLPILYHGRIILVSGSDFPLALFSPYKIPPTTTQNDWLPRLHTTCQTDAATLFPTPGVIAPSGLA